MGGAECARATNTHGDAAVLLLDGVPFVVPIGSIAVAVVGGCCTSPVVTEVICRSQSVRVVPAMRMVNVGVKAIVHVVMVGDMRHGAANRHGLGGSVIDMVDRGVRGVGRMVTVVVGIVADVAVVGFIGSVIDMVDRGVRGVGRMVTVVVGIVADVAVVGFILDRTFVHSGVGRFVAVAQTLVEGVVPPRGAAVVVAAILRVAVVVRVTAIVRIAIVMGIVMMNRSTDWGALAVAHVTGVARWDRAGIGGIALCAHARLELLAPTRARRILFSAHHRHANLLNRRFRGRGGFWNCLGSCSST
mmetsp:Transcript_16682/g.31571  ORF Transcript_16682/g.31571 Transcript_16682/m.31571 type:complete len:302 (+) Transcript_16682:31-936(+)